MEENKINDNNEDMEKAGEAVEEHGIPVASLSFLSEITPDFWDF